MLHIAEHVLHLGFLCLPPYEDDEHFEQASIFESRSYDSYYTYGSLPPGDTTSERDLGEVGSLSDLYDPPLALTEPESNESDGEGNIRDFSKEFKPSIQTDDSENWDFFPWKSFDSSKDPKLNRIAFLQGLRINEELPGFPLKPLRAEDDTEISRALRAYYTEKERPFPGWLPPVPISGVAT
jgi:hypothetical protein